jgi:S1-C subfamily serine protease
VRIQPHENPGSGFLLKGVMIKPWPFFSEGEEVLRLNPTTIRGVYEGEQKWKSLVMSRWAPARVVVQGDQLFTQYNSVRFPTRIPTTWTYIREGAPSGPPAPPAEGSVAGSGFLVRGSRHVLTSNHVVEGAQRVRVVFNGQEHEAVVVKQDKRNDLALLSIPTLVASPDAGLAVDPSVPVRPGETVWAIGFPLGDLLGRDPSIVSGLVSAAAGLGDDTTQFRIAGSFNPGNSGGPIVNQYGQVVGIAVARVRRDLAEGIALGIKIGTAAPLGPELLLTHVSVERQPIAPERLYELIAPAVVRIVADPHK